MATGESKTHLFSELVIFIVQSRIGPDSPMVFVWLIVLGFQTQMVNARTERRLVEIDLWSINLQKYRFLLAFKEGCQWIPGDVPLNGTDCIKSSKVIE